MKTSEGSPQLCIGEGIGFAGTPKIECWIQHSLQGKNYYWELIRFFFQSYSVHFSLYMSFCWFLADNFCEQIEKDYFRTRSVSICSLVALSALLRHSQRMENHFQSTSVVIFNNFPLALLSKVLVDLRSINQMK